MAQESLYQHASDAAIVSKPLATTLVSGGVTIIGGLTLNEVAMVVGMVGVFIGLLFQALGLLATRRKLKIEAEALLEQKEFARQREQREALAHQRALKAQDEAAAFRKRKEQTLAVLEEHAEAASGAFTPPEHAALHVVFADTDVPKGM